MRNSSKLNPSNIVLSDAYERLQACHAEEDVERVVARACMNPDTVKDSLFADGIDEDCFWDVDCRRIFLVAKELFLSSGIVSPEKVAENSGLSVDFLNSLEEGRVEHLEYYVKILQQKRIQRAVIRECYHLLEMAMNKETYIDELLERCGQFQKIVLFGKPDDIRPVRNAKNDWFVKEETGKRYKVLPGKDDMPDFCVIEGKFVSEPKMLRNGFKRITKNEQ